MSTIKITDKPTTTEVTGGDKVFVNKDGTLRQAGVDDVVSASQTAAELADIRTDSAGTKHNSAGEAVRSQVTTLHDKIATAATALTDVIDTKAPAIVQTVSGASIVVQDSAEALLQDLIVYGKSEQDITTGAQLFDKSKATIGYEINSADGSISESATMYVSDFIEVIENETYYLSKYIEKYGVSNCFYDENKIFLSTITKNEGDLLVPSGAKYLRFNGTINGIDSVMLNAGSTALPYEPYTGNKPSPSPDYPQDIVSVGDTGSLMVESCGKNLYNKDVYALTFNYAIDANTGMVYKTEKGDYYAIIDYIPFTEFAGKKIVATPMTIVCYDAEKVAIKGFTLSSEMYFEVPQNTAYIRFDVFKDYINTVQLEYGTVATGYEPYKGTSITIPLAEPLRAIDSIKDEITQQGGVYGVYRRLSAVVLDGSEEWSVNTYVSNQYCFTLKGAKKDSKVICNCYKYNKGNDIAIDTYILLGSFLNIRNVNINTVEELQESLAKNPITVVYQLATPVFEPFAEETNNAIKSLMSYKPVTTIYNSDSAEMSVDYATDTKIYIDNKFAELSAAILT